MSFQTCNTYFIYLQNTNEDLFDEITTDTLTFQNVHNKVIQQIHTGFMFMRSLFELLQEPMTFVLTPGSRFGWASVYVCW